MPRRLGREAAIARCRAWLVTDGKEDEKRNDPGKAGALSRGASVVIGVRAAGARYRGVFPLAGQDEDHGLAGEAVLFDGLGQQVEAG